MSNHLAVAAVTSTLVQLLDAQLAHDFVGARAVPSRPDEAAAANADPEVRVFLYRVEPNGSWRANALPARSSSGQVFERPQIGLTLQYLLAFVGNEGQLEPQRMLGSAVRALTARPLLSRAAIEEMVQAAIASDPNHPLALTDLAEQPEIVRINLLPLSLDELSNLWSSFFQTPYQLSVAYEASVVVLTADETPTRSLPVRERTIFTTTLLRPTIVRTAAVDGPFVPVVVGSHLEIAGSQLRAEEITVVAFGGIEVVPEPDLVSGVRIEVEVPAGVRAGVSALRILHRRLMGVPPAPRLAGQSNVFPVVIQPQLQPPLPGTHDITVDADNLRAGGITVSLDPPVGRRQQVTLMLNAAPGGAGGAFVFEGERRDGDGEPDETPDLDLPFAGVPAGTYLLRVAVDGAETPLVTDTVVGSPTEGQYTGPQVVIP